MPDRVMLTLRAVQTRMRVHQGVLALAAAAAAFAAVVLVCRLASGAGPAASSGVAAVIGALVGLTAWGRRGPMSLVEAAVAVERASSACDNLVVTAAELVERPRPVRAEIHSALETQVDVRLRTITVANVVPLTQSVLLAALTIAGAALVSRAAGVVPSSHHSQDTQASSIAPGDFLVRVTPPAYTRRAPEVLNRPVQITTIAGSQIRIESGAGETIREFVAATSTSLDVPLSGGATRFLSVIVVPDGGPTVRVAAPGKDSAFVEPKGRVPVDVEAVDDLGLASVAVRYTKASGGGENVTFTQGEMPVRIDRRSERDWRAHAEFVLDGLNLADGDVLVYRAVARDTNPAGQAVQSEPYVIEIGKNAMVADAGFALPAEEKKYAISQQMVIYKTEQLLAKGRVPDLLEQARGIAVEQRMVRAEVVFLGGGEVEDELEEAAGSNELVEGRLQNSGRMEMLRAVNAMSRAEAQLNDGRAAEALVLEKQALASLEKALDRRRYFLRTLPDRSRIDTSRRLSGERKTARSWSVDPLVAPDPASVDEARAVMRDLSRVAASGGAVEAGLPSRIVAIEPSSPALQQAAVAVASATDGQARRRAAQEAMQALAGHVMATLPGSVAITIPDAPLAGELGDRLSRRPRQ